MTAATASPYPLLSAPTRTSIRSTLTTGCRPRCRSSHRNGGCPNEPARGRHRGLRGYAGGKLDRHIPDPDGLYILPECARASEGARFARAQDHCRLSSSQWLERARALAIACRHSQIELRMTGGRNNSSHRSRADQLGGCRPKGLAQELRYQISKRRPWRGTLPQSPALRSQIVAELEQCDELYGTFIDVDDCIPPDRERHLAKSRP